jgi:large subunit ribosomal protein L10
MPKADKVATVAEITDRFRNSSAAVVTEYRGLTMAQLTELRRSLGKDTEYTVAKNTLVKRAAADAGVSGLDDLFVGPTAVAFVSGEPVDAAKALRDFAKAHPLLVIKGGLLDGRAIQAGEVNKLADLESREVLLGKMAGAMLATLTKAAVVLNALPSQVARLAAALQEKRIADGETLDAPASPDAESSADPAAVGVQAVSAEAPAEGADSTAAADESTTPEAVSTEVPAEGADAGATSTEGTTEETAAQA